MLGTPETVGNQHVLVGLARIPARQAAPWHQHHGHEEFVYVLEGAGQFWCQGSPPLAVGPGSFNLIPPERWHMHRSTLTEDLVFLWGYAPPGTRLTG